MHIRRTTGVALAATLVLALGALPSLAAPGNAPGHAHGHHRSPAASALGAEQQRLLAEVRRATARYHDVDVALADGYVAISPCVPEMGFHYARLMEIETGAGVEVVPVISAGPDDLDHRVPELLVYAPRADGSVRLVAVEYGSWAPASLFGTSFDPPAPEGSGGPPFHTLHAWVWQANPSGMFAAHNPNVSCG